jgi:ribose 5-phosphate isomerase B
MRIAIGVDHGGFPLKAYIVDFLRRAGYDLVDLGTHSAESVDYPDFARAVAETLLCGEADRGILICGSGVGASIAANKLPGIRAGLCHDTFSARQGVEDDDANILCMGARVIGPELALEVVRAFLNARFSELERHQRRLAKVAEMERRYRQTTADSKV